MKEDQTTLLVLLAIYLWGRGRPAFAGPAGHKYGTGVPLNLKPDPTISTVKRVAKKAATKAAEIRDNAANAIEEAGKKIYETVHNDESHTQDLPGTSLSKAAVLEITTAAGFPDPKLAAAIAFAESGGSTGAVNRTSRELSVGLFQINTLAHPYSITDMKDPKLNAHAAFTLSKGGKDWHRWSAFNNGKYKQFQTGILAP